MSPNKGFLCTGAVFRVVLSRVFEVFVNFSVRGDFASFQTGILSFGPSGYRFLLEIGLQAALGPGRSHPRPAILLPQICQRLRGDLIQLLHAAVQGRFLGTTARSTTSQRSYSLYFIIFIFIRFIRFSQHSVTFWSFCFKSFF